MAETTRKHNAEAVLAVEVDPCTADLRENLAVYRRVSASQKAAIAAELRRKVEIEIAEDRRPHGRRPGRLRDDGPFSRLMSTLRVMTGIVPTDAQF